MTGTGPTRTGRPLRVLQVVQRFHPELGGLETHVAEVTRRLAGHDVEVTVLTTDRTGALPRTARVNGVPVLRRRSWPRHGEAYLSPGLVRVIRRGGWDLVHVQGSQTTVPTVAMAAALSARIPYVLTFHSGGHSSPRHAPITALQNRINRPLLARARMLIAVSRFERSRFQRITGLPAERFTVIENGGALPLIDPAVAPVPGSIITSGRLERYKGHHRVITALPLIRAEVPDARVTVLGSGPYESELRRLASASGVEDAVEFRALRPEQRAEMADALARTSVMAALSDYEAHPVAVMEAVALGLPVVGADVAGIGDLVEDGLVTGISPEAGDAEVARLLADRLRAQGGAPHRPPAVALPTWERCTDRLAEVYRRAAGPRAEADPRPEVVQIITTLVTGGAERQLESLVHHSRYRQHVIALYGGGAVADALRANGHSVEVMHLDGVRRLLALPLLTRRLRQLRPQAVQVHLLSGQLWGLPAARLANVPIRLSTEHSLMDDTIENRPLTPALRALYLALARLATRTIAVSRETARRLERWGLPAERIDVVANGIDLDAVAFDADARQRVRAELDVRGDAVLIGAIGRLEPVKRFPQLLAAVAPTLVVGRRELLIAGAGPLADALRAQAEALGVADAVHLLGPRGDVPALLSAIDVLVSASRDETFGMAAIEAIAAGLPVVHAQIPALDDLGAPVRGTVRISDVDAEEGPSIRAGIDQALALAGGERLPAPQSIRAAYDIVRTVGRMDDLARPSLRGGAQR